MTSRDVYSIHGCSIGKGDTLVLPHMIHFEVTLRDVVIFRTHTVFRLEMALRGP